MNLYTCLLDEIAAQATAEGSNRMSTGQVGKLEIIVFPLEKLDCSGLFYLLSCNLFYFLRTASRTFDTVVLIQVNKTLD